MLHHSGNGRSGLKCFTQLFPNLPSSPLQLSSASQLSDTPACRPPRPTTTTRSPKLSPLPALYLLFLFCQCSLHSLPSVPSLHPRAPCFEPGLESVHPEVCHWADGLISGRGSALRRAERSQGPWTGVLWLDLLPAQSIEESDAPWMLHILNRQCSPVLPQWCRSASYTFSTEWEHGI